MKKLSFKKIGIIGLGRIGSALLEGLLNIGYQKENFVLKVRQETQKYDLISRGFEARIDLDAIFSSDIIFIAVKPAHIHSILSSFRYIPKSLQKPVISLCAGVCYSDLSKILGKQYPVFRVRPNIFIRNNAGNLLFSPNSNTTLFAQEVKSLLSGLGKVFTVNEVDLSSYTLDSSTIPGILMTRIMLERLEHLPDEKRKLASELMISGVQGLILELRYQVEKERIPFERALHHVIARIASPAGFNDTMLNRLNQENFWTALRTAFEVYERLEKVYSSTL